MPASGARRCCSLPRCWWWSRSWPPTSTGFLVGLLVANAAILLWRSAAIAHAGLWPWRDPRDPERTSAVVAVGLLLAATLAMHVWVGVVVVQVEGTLTEVFAGVSAKPVMTSEVPRVTASIELS